MEEKTINIGMMLASSLNEVVHDPDIMAVMIKVGESVYQKNKTRKRAFIRRTIGTSTTGDSACGFLSLWRVRPLY